MNNRVPPKAVATPKPAEKVIKRPAPEGFRSRLATIRQAPRHVKGMIYGPVRVGKTYIFGTGVDDPRIGPILHLDFDQGGTTLVGIPNEKLVSIPILDWEDYDEAYEYLANDGGSAEYNTVVIDSLSFTHLYSLLGIAEARAGSAEKAKRQDANKLEQDDYGRSLIQMMKFVNSFIRLPMNVFFTCHAKTEEEAGEGMIKKPMLSGQFSEQIIGLLDVVGFLKTEKKADPNDPAKRIVQRQMTLVNDGKVRAGVRTPWGVKTPTHMVNPTLPMIFDLLGVPKPE